MAHVSVTINGRTYRMACDDGQEAHLGALGTSLEARIAELRGAFGEIGDMRLTVMAAITISDELAERERRVAALEERLNQLDRAQDEAEARSRASQAAMADAIEAAAGRLEKLTRKLLEEEKAGLAGP